MIAVQQAMLSSADANLKSLDREFTYSHFEMFLATGACARMLGGSN